MLLILFLFQVECSNGQIGFGRKKRAIPISGDKNRIFEVTMSTFIKVDWDGNTVQDEGNSKKKYFKILFLMESYF